MTQNDLFQSILAFTMLTLGGAIYLFFREPVLFTSWIPSIWWAEIPHYGHLINAESFMGGFFLYSLADALWYGSLLIIEYQLRSNTLFSRIMILTTVTLPFVYEVLQRIGFVSGTFDWNDILAYLLTLLIFILCTRKSSCSC